VVVSVPAGTVVASGLAAAVVVRLPATTAELAADLPEATAADVAAAVDDLVARGVIVGGGR
jgi:hypothetical protein